MPTDSNERALLTDREREILEGEADVTNNYQRKVKSLARSRIQSLRADTNVLRNEHPELYALLKEVVDQNE